MIKVNKFAKALSKFEERAAPLSFFYKYEMQFREEIEVSTVKRKKMEER